MNVLLREGHLDARLFEGAVNGGVQFVSHGPEMLESQDEYAQLELERAIAEVLEGRGRRRVLQDQRMGVRGVEQQLRGQLRVRSISDAYLNDHPQHRIGQGPVDDVAGDE